MKNYYDCDECQQIKDGSSALVDTALWDTLTCKLGWDSNGVFPKGADGSDVNHVDANANRTQIAAADDNATLCVYRYPCLANTQDCRRLSGHSEHVTRVRFFEQDGMKPEDLSDRIITAGGMDRTYIQWRPVPVAKVEDTGGVIRFQ